jgi:flagellar biosynthesis protein FlhF
MRLETFRGPDLGRVVATAQASLGEDAMIVSNRVLRLEGTTLVEIVAARAADVERFRMRIEPTPLLPPDAAGPGRSRPFVVALVGPTGAGKTTTAAKLAVGPQAFGGRRVGLLTLDTFRVGALEQLSAYAEIAGLPLEVVYHPREVRPALRRLASCEVIIVDTPGRSPRAQELNEGWREILGQVTPDEVHLVVPATLRLDLAAAMQDVFSPFGVTHMLLTKLDEVPGDSGIADLAMRLTYPARWITDGQEIPADLRPAGARIIAALGKHAEDVAPLRVAG